MGTALQQGSGKFTADGEIWATETERENDVWAQYAGSYAVDTYVIIISKDNIAFPHKLQGQNGDRIDVTSIYYAIDLAASTRATLKFGVITRIDGTNADIRYFGGVPFLSGVTQETLVQPLRGVPSQVKLDFDNNGILQHGVTNDVETDVGAINTGLTLASPVGVITPGLGDVILKYEHVAGSSDVAVFVFYHNSD